MSVAAWALAFQTEFKLNPISSVLGALGVFWAPVIALSFPGGHGRDMQYVFSVQEHTAGNNVVVAFTIMPQSLNTEEERFPLQFQVFKVSIVLWLLFFVDAVYTLG